MTPKDKATELVDVYKTILMNEDTECGNEILCTVIAKKSALVTSNEVIIYLDAIMLPNPFKQYWDKVKDEIEKL